MAKLVITSAILRCRAREGAAQLLPAAGSDSTKKKRSNSMSNNFSI
ncbi:hypothetical protein GQ55_3G436600 [Panicum hallii var. hallii]|uniref:Uncharacterized protein n=1 Tax=Panicum hallii var. hallii TaxID=1504633 RepID=A0A2T7EHZ5_9POAL|nr:hypothetical protein GQ55_3G436600 [Panicum hallii var. hallii]